METRPNRKKSIIIIIAMIAIVIVAAVLITNNANKTPSIGYNELISKMENGEIKGVYFTGVYKVNVLYTKEFNESKDKDGLWSNFIKGKAASATAIVLSRERVSEAMDNAAKNDITVAVIASDPNARSISSYILPAISTILLIGIGIMFFMAMRGKGGAGAAFDFAKTDAIVATKVKVRFDDVAGAEEEKEELKEIVEFLKQPKKFRDVGARIPKGVLLVGQPGTGKTLFAKAVAGEANVPFYSISGSDFVEMFVGVGASRVRNLFKQAKRTQPCIVFIDEIDAVGRRRGAGLGGGNDEREQTLNQLLVQMDGFDENDGVVIMAATNRADVLDPALMRPGRFDRQVYVHMPDVKGREAIFKVHSRNKPLASEVDFKNLARLTSGFSGADIENLLNEAAIFAARDDRKVIFMKDILEGINKVIAGPQKKSRVVTERDKKITAYHEAGHALVGRFMKNSDAIQEVSIIPRGAAAGYTISRPKTDDSHVTFNYLVDTIAMTLGGRAAEEIVFEDISTGASQDIKQATAMARNMVVEWGMSPKLPNTYFGGEGEVFIGRDFQTQTGYSEEIAAIIDNEIRRIIDENYVRAKTCLIENRKVLDDMVDLLFKHETIYGDEVDMLIAGKTVEEVSEKITQKQEERDKEAERIKKEAEEEAKKKEALEAIKAIATQENLNIKTPEGDVNIKFVDAPMPKDFKPDPLDKTIYIFKTENGKKEEKPQSKVVKVEEPKPDVKLEDTTPKADEKVKPKTQEESVKEAKVVDATSKEEGTSKADEKAKPKTQEESVKEVKADVASKKEATPKGDIAPQDNTKKEKTASASKVETKKAPAKKTSTEKDTTKKTKTTTKKDDVDKK
ncbi:MAG: ATP-dependent zinc metalloprotease FtsH [Clostridiales bacterium]|jgi:cell division protease FtsH|nr:ATP-dependent zinc metalloprotease FtsH [Clostridiales bacterium]